MGRKSDSARISIRTGPSESWPLSVLTTWQILLLVNSPECNGQTRTGFLFQMDLTSRLSMMPGHSKRVGLQDAPINSAFHHFLSSFLLKRLIVPRRGMLLLCVRAQEMFNRPDSSRRPGRGHLIGATFATFKRSLSRGGCCA